MARLEAHFKLCEVDFGVAVHVKSAKNRDQVLLRNVAASSLQEAFYVGAVQVAEPQVIDGFECLFESKVILILQTPFQVIGLDLKPHFFENQQTQRFLNM